jgi:hypothetical protein
MLAVTTSSSTRALWYLTRASGLVSLVLLTLVMLLGISQIEGWAPARSPRFVTAALHRNVSLLAVVFLGVHIVSAVVDSYAPISLAAAVLPFASAYRPLWLSLGALAFDLILALVITSLLRPRISYGLWRTIHWAAYACWPLAFVHGLGTGSDGRVGWVQAVNLACLVAILAALAWRLAAGWRLAPARRLVGAIASSVTALVVLAWALGGPTQLGWAKRAGTPTALLKSASIGAPTSTTTTTAPGTSTLLPLQGQLDGTLTQSGAGRSTTVTIDVAVVGTDARVRIVLEGTALDDGGLALSHGTVQVGPSSQPNRYSGPVTSLNGGDLRAQLTDGSGSTAVAAIRLQIDPTTEHVTGAIDVR